MSTCIVFTFMHCSDTRHYVHPSNYAEHILWRYTNLISTDLLVIVIDDYCSSLILYKGMFGKYDREPKIGSNLIYLKK